MRLSRLRCLISLLVLLAPTAGIAQIQLEDRELRGRIGFTNTSIAVPAPLPGTILGRSIGISDPLNNSGVVFGGTGQEREHRVVVQAFSGGSYWLTSVLNLGSQFYRFGYAANAFAAPGYPNFLNDVYRPVTVPVVPSSSDPIIGVDLLECAGSVRVRFIESDGQGGLRPITRTIVAGQVVAYPRIDPASSGPPFSYRSGEVFNLSGGAQAVRALPVGGQDVPLLVRSSDQTGGPAIRYRLQVDWTMACPLANTPPNPLCPTFPGAVSETSYFEGEMGSFGMLGTGGAESAPGQSPGLHVACDSVQDLFVIVPDMCPVPMCPVLPEEASYEGCVNLIGETEVESDCRTQMSTSTGGSTCNVSNSGESPAPFSSLFSNFAPVAQEGLYEVPALNTPVQQQVQSFFAMSPLAGQPLNFLDSPRVTVASPPGGTTATGPDFCMVPGVYEGTVILRDALTGGSPSGAVADLDAPGSSLLALGPAGGVAQRRLRGGALDPVTGTYMAPYENIFANPDNLAGAWSQPRMIHRFSNSSSDPASFALGANRVEFTQPTGGFLFEPEQFISVAEGGLWSGPLEPSTQIAERAARTFPVDYELCYSSLRVQVNSRTVRFFNPRITQYTGAFQDDRGTPLQPADDIAYGVFPQQEWAGSPRNEPTASVAGFVNLRLPQGTYTDIGGFVTTVLGPGLTGTTELPQMDIDLGCGESCTAIPNAILCLSPIDRCNDPAILLNGVAAISGTLNHDNPIARGFYQIDGGPEVAIDLTAAGVTCGPTPCADEFTISVTGFTPCRNRIEVSFVDSLDTPISAFLFTTIDQVDPGYRVNPAQDPASPPFPCGGEVRFSPPMACDAVPRSIVPIPIALDDCSATGDPDSPLSLTDDAPAFFPFGTTTVTLAAVDACGNGASCETRVVIEDTTPPSLICGPSAGFTFPADADCTSLRSIAAQIGDNCDAAGQLAISSLVTLPGGSTLGGNNSAVTVDFPLGRSTVQFTVTDTHGNQSSCSVDIDVVDTTRPRMICPFGGPLIIPNMQWLDGINLHMIYGSDLTIGFGFWVGGAPGYTLFRRQMGPLTGVDPMLPDLGTVLLADQPITDYTEPLIPLPHTSFFYRVFQQDDGIGVFECGMPDGADLPLIARVNDNCPIASLSNSRTGPTLDASGVFPMGSTVVTFAGADGSGNQASCNSEVQVVDTTPPAIQCPPPITIVSGVSGLVASTDPDVLAWLASATGSDLCGGTVLVHDLPGSIQTSCDAASVTTETTFTATDDVGLTSLCTTLITVTADPALLDADGDGYACGQDCDDTLAAANPAATEVCDGVDNDCDAAVDEEPEAGASCADASSCTADACVAGSCTHIDTSAACDDGNACTADSCEPLSGCVNQDTSAQCNDGVACTVDSCDPASGCAFTQTDSCPRTIGYYGRLCLGDHPEDELTAGDAACVDNAATFGQIASVQDMCRVLNWETSSDACEKAEAQFMALMLNRCRGRAPDSLAINSVCTDNTTVGESAVEADALLANPSRTIGQCVLARCESEEINSGAALGIGP